MNRALTLTLVLAMTGTACTSGLYEIDDGKTKGIPFYTKTAFCRQESIHDEPRYLVTLLKEELVPAENKPPTWKEVNRTSIELSHTGYSAARDDSLLIDGSDQDLSKNFAAIVNCRCRYPRPSGGGSGLPENPADYRVVTQRGVIEVVVDYQNVHYINTRRAWSGSANSTVKLAPDGTLTTATAALEDTTFETILDVVPVSAYLTDLLNIGNAVSATAQPTKRTRLVVKPTVVRHRFWKMTKDNPADCGSPQPALTVTAAGVSYDRQIMDSGSGGNSQPAPDNNTIKIEGAIHLPED